MYFLAYHLGNCVHSQLKRMALQDYLSLVTSVGKSCSRKQQEELRCVIFEIQNYKAATEMSQPVKLLYNHG